MSWTGENDESQDKSSKDFTLDIIPEHQNSISNEKEYVANESIVVESDNMTIWIFDQNDLMELETPVKNSILAYMEKQTRDQLEKAWDDRITAELKQTRLQQIAVEYLFDGIRSNDGPESDIQKD